MDTYTNFEELVRNEQEGRDFIILSRDMGSAIAVMAPHGGGIETGTLDIADALSGTDWSFYAFSGIKKSGNRQLHLTSNRFDEPIGLRIARKAAVVIAVHGHRDEGDAVFLGGRNDTLKRILCDALTAAVLIRDTSPIFSLLPCEATTLCTKIGEVSLINTCNWKFAEASGKRCSKISIAGRCERKPMSFMRLWIQ